ncbi:MAG: hypothetical protein V3U65_08585 [Granulosicoccaceae bacterium]
MTAQTPLQQLAECKPKIAENVVKQSLMIRGELWVLLQNSINGEHLRLNAAAAQWLDAFDGETTVATVLNNAQADDATAQQVFECLNLLGQADMVVLGAADEHARLFAQHENHNSMAKQRKRNPLAIRFPLLDPDAWLSSNSSRWSLFFNRYFAYFIASVLVIALILAFVNADGLRQSWSNLSGSPSHWWWYGLLFPLLKLLHELAHAICIKRWGGAVHEAGITLLVLMPIPYVDASDSWFFEKRSHRLITAAAGIIAETVAVAFALIVWSMVEPGLLRDFAFAIAVLGTVSTLLFNANPLLRFDGYFILQDLIDMPNLGSRASAYYRYLVRRYAFKVTTAVTPCTAVGERRWLLGYGAAAFFYRIFITLTIALFLAKQYFFIGFALALLALYQLLAKPAVKAIAYLRNSVEIDQIRDSVVMKSTGMVVAVTITIAFIPLPSSTRAEGVVWVPSQAQVFAGETGTLHTQHVKAGESVEAGDLLFTLTSHKLNALYKVVSSKQQSVTVDYRAARTNDIEEARQLAVDLKSLDSQLVILGQRQAALQIRASRAGVFALSSARALLGSYIKQGDQLAFLVADNNLVVRAVIDQGAMGRIDKGVTRSTIRLADNFSNPLQSEVIQHVPSGNHQLPSPSLAYNGRSGIAVASAEGEELKTAERVFHVELSLPVESRVVGIGGRAYVNLQHWPESLGRRWWRSARQLLLKQLTV